ncbi:hypothetical protein SAMN04490248_12227 [Salinihabitans flavidus]|uniref:Mono-oxygenase ydhR n=1 Tax=Salinihabitans flavidus TaxID=569882 RepID=A0A1H8UTI8_9RHOB|nr:hypothetical protein [Salinihabitans flavidus]SEP06456.1 hypothetical protein SAMN04490248_12227 [Salinihabitans flavidus]
MITEIVTFALRPGTTRQRALELFEKTVPRWRANTALVRKYYLFDGVQGRGGGVYLWSTLEDAKAAHDTAWCDQAEALYGDRPRFEYFETPLIVDNTD